MSQRYHSGALALLLPLNRQSVKVNFDTVNPYPLARDTELWGRVFPDAVKEHTIFNSLGCLILEGEGTVFLLNGGNYSPNNSASHPTRPKFSPTPL